MIVFGNVMLNFTWPIKRSDIPKHGNLITTLQIVKTDLFPVLAKQLILSQFLGRT